MSGQGKQSVAIRLSALKAEGKKGIEIARVLYQEGYNIEEVRGAFYQEGYMVSIEESVPRFLHVSDNPMQAGLAVLFASIEPRALPEIAWWPR